MDKLLKAEVGDRVLVDLVVKAVIYDDEGVSYRVAPSLKSPWTMVVSEAQISENIDQMLDQIQKDNPTNFHYD